MALANPAYMMDPAKLDSKYKEEEDGVREVEDLMDFVIKTDMDEFDQEFQVREEIIRAFINNFLISLQ